MSVGRSNQRAAEPDLRRGDDLRPTEGLRPELPATAGWGAEAPDRLADGAREDRKKQKGDPLPEVTLFLRVFLPVFSP